MSDLFILDVNDDLLAVLSNETQETCQFKDAPFKEILNQGSTFEFTAQGDHEDSKYLVAENQVLFKDKDGNFRLFTIKEPEKVNGDKGPEIHLICEPGFLEIDDDPLEDLRAYDATAFDAATKALSNSRWKPGIVDDLGLASTNFYYESGKDAIEKVIKNWKAEFRDRVEFDGNRITGRYIDILARRGQDIGKIWEIDKDVINIKHKILSYPKTALYGRGPSLQTESGGYTRKTTFADVVWSVANGDPVDKPLGQEWVGDPEALEMFGRPNTDDPNGPKRHRFGFFDDDAEDETILLQRTWDELQLQKNVIENFASDTILLGDLAGYEHEKVRLGDTARATVRTFSSPIQIQARVVSFEYDVSDPEIGYVEMGQYINLYSDEQRLRDIETKLNDRAPIWDKNGETPDIVDENFPDIIPNIPTGFVAKGLFKSIKLNWEYDPTSYIAAYEVHASKVQDFIPGNETLAFRGKTSGVLFEADTDDQWYFRLRAVNTHGNASEFTDEVMAQTARVSGQDIVEETITNSLLAADISADKIVSGTLTAIAIYGVTITGSVFMSTNGNFQIDDNGLMIIKDQSKTTLDELGLTGWFDTTGGGAWEKVFYLNEDETVTKKVRAMDEITMGQFKIINVNGGGKRGWAFVPIS